MKLKNKIIAGIFSAVAVTAIPVSIALSAVSCGSGTIDGSDNSQQPDTPVDPSPEPQPQPGPTPPAQDPVEPPAPGPTPPPTPTPTPEGSVELTNEQITNISKIINDELGKLTSDNGADIENGIKTSVNNTLTSTGVTIDSVVLTPTTASETDEFVSYNVALNFSSEKTVTLQSSTTLKVEGKQILTVAPIQTTVKNPQHSLVISEDQISAISTILNTEVAKLNGSNESDIQTAIQTQVNKALEGNGVSIDSVVLTQSESTPSAEFLSYNVALNFTSAKIITLASSTTLKIQGKQILTVNPIKTTVKNPLFPVEISEQQISAISTILNTQVNQMNSSNLEETKTNILTQVNEQLKDLGVVVSSVVLTPKEADSTVQFLSYDVTLNIGAQPVVTLASQTTLKKVENTLVTVAPIASVNKNPAYVVTLSTAKIDAISKILNDQVSTLTSSNQDEIKANIKGQVNAALDGTGISVSTVELNQASTAADAKFVSYNVVLNTTSVNQFALENESVLTKTDNKVSTVTPIVTKIQNTSYAVTISADHINKINGILTSEVAKLTATNATDIQNAIKTQVSTELNSLGITVESVVLNPKADTPASEPYVSYNVTLNIHCDTNVVLATDNVLSKIGDAISTVEASVSLVPNKSYVATLSAAQVSSIMDIYTAELNKLDASNEATITEAIKTQVTPILETSKIVLNSVTLDKQPIVGNAQFISYKVSLNVTSDYTINLENQDSIQNNSGTLVTVNSIVSTNKNPDYTVTLDNAKILEISNILKAEVATLSSSNEAEIKSNIQTQVNEKLQGTGINVTSVDLTAVAATASDKYISYNVALNVTSADKMTLEDQSVLTYSENKLSTVTPIVTTIENTAYTVTISAEQINTINGILTSELAKLTSSNSTEIQDSIKSKVNTELNSLGVSVDSVVLTAKADTPASEQFIPYNVTLNLASTPNVELASNSVLSKTNNAITTVNATTTLIPNANYLTNVSAAQISQIMGIYEAQLKQLNDSNLDQITEAIKTQVTPILETSKITLNSVSLQEQPAVDNPQFISYKVALNVASDYTINLENQESIQKVDNTSLVTVSPIVSTKKNPSYTVTIDEAKIDQINSILNTQVATLSSSNQEQLKTEIQSQVNNVLNGTGISVTSVDLTAAEAFISDEFIPYNVALNVTSENLFALATNKFLTKTDNKISTINPIKTTIANPEFPTLQVGQQYEANGFQYEILKDPNDNSFAFKLNKITNASLAKPDNLANEQGDVVVDVPGKGKISLPLVLIGDENGSIFGDDTSLASTWTGNLVIPNKVRAIASGAFENASGLTGDLVIPDSVDEIGQASFQNFHINGKLVLSNSLPTIKSFAFASAIFTGELSIPSSVKSISQSAFENCTGFTAISIPNTVTKIGKNAFKGCTGLPEQTITKPTSATWDATAFDGTKVIVISVGDQFIKKGYKYTIIEDKEDKSLGFELTKLMDLSVAKPEELGNPDGNVTIPVENKGSFSLPLIQIGRNACGFFSPNQNDGINYVGNLVIPNKVKRIEDGAFVNCQALTGDLIIPNSVKWIGASFDNLLRCTGKLVLSNQLTFIGGRAFHGGAFTGELVIPDSVKEIAIWAFQQCTGFTSLTLPSTVKTIGGYAFEGCTGLTAQTITQPVGTDWDPSAFENTKITFVPAPAPTTK